MKRFALLAFCFLLFTVSALCDGLKIFGQDFFSNMNLATSEAARFIPEKYFLGTGDLLEISVWGPVEFRQQAEIDREGNILIPRIGKLYLSGKSLTQAKKYIQEMFDRTYKNVKVELTLIKGKIIPVFVMGEIIRPGAYVVTSSSTILEVIAMAGGINARGSLRKIVVISKDGTKKEIDLYPTLFGGTIPEIYFQPEDIVYVPLAKNFVGIKGAVRRPAIYESTEKISLAALIEYAGGFLPEADTKRIAVFRNEPGAGRTIIDVFLTQDKRTELRNFILSDGDEVEISFFSKDIIDYVMVEGTVKNQGKYQWKQGLSVADIIRETDFLPETLLEKAEIIREKPDGAREIAQFSLIDAVKKTNNIELNPRDRIIVRSKDRPVKKVTISGEVKFPGEYMISSGETLSSLIKRAGGFTSAAYLPAAVFTRVSVRQREKQEIEKFIMEKQATIEKEAGRIESEEEKALIEKSKGLLKQLAQAPVTGRVVVCLEPWDKFAGSDADITLEDGDVINIPTKPTIVSVMGEVNHSANVLYANGADYKYYIEKAGSFTKNADVKNIFVVKANGTATTNLKKIEPGDVIVVGFLAKDRPGKILKDILQMLYYVKMIIE
ncbi:MAG: SLBB domain-containing protein [Candidatus Omnitrophica bacterium]|nr:SLBB domain-containing protein [Candidatus Omnitrophota bacterium]MCM8827986.1 SLBB domain-containing protein [Candidatus Omnitrophota bacterium]